ncbi:MAG: flagellin [Rubrivivax sp.]
MSDVNLSNAVRANLLGLQSSTTQTSKTQVRSGSSQTTDTGLQSSTGSVTAKSLDTRASDMATLLDTMSNAIKTIDTADSGLTSITDVITQMQELLTAAQDGSSGDTSLEDLATQLNALREQIDQVSGSSSYNGTNLLNGDTLKLSLGDSGTSALEVQLKTANGTATSVDSSTLGLPVVDSADLDSDGAISSILDTLSSALDTLGSISSSLASDRSTVESRTDFTKNMISTLETSASSLALTDTSEEAVNLLALQTRQQLSSTGLSMATPADQAVLRLF